MICIMETKFKSKIPKGSEIYDGKKLIATTNKDLFKGDIPKPEDFTPNLPKGLKINTFIVKFGGEIIYIHPNFIN